MDIRLKRVYERPAKSDGVRVLVDRIWPRGVRREDAELDEWLKDVAPSNELRKWFNHDPERWDGFAEKYRRELVEHAEPVKRLVELTKKGRLTLVFGASDTDHNNAVVLKNYLQEILKK